MAANGEEVAVASVPLLRFESLCGALRTGLTEAITLKTESDKGAAAFLALQSSAMGLLELKEVRVPFACHARATRTTHGPTSRVVSCLFPTAFPVSRPPRGSLQTPTHPAARHRLR
jgi:hypothetical protein